MTAVRNRALPSYVGAGLAFEVGTHLSLTPDQNWVRD